MRDSKRNLRTTLQLIHAKVTKAQREGEMAGGDQQVRYAWDKFWQGFAHLVQTKKKQRCHSQAGRIKKKLSKVWEATSNHIQLHGKGCGPVEPESITDVENKGSHPDLKIWPGLRPARHNLTTSKLFPQGRIEQSSTGVRHPVSCAAE